MRIPLLSLGLFATIASSCLFHASIAQAQPAPDERRFQNNGRPPEPAPEEAIARVLQNFATLSSGPDTFFEIAHSVSGIKLGYYGGQELLREWAKDRGKAYLGVTKVELFDTKGDETKARVTYTWNTKQFSSEPITETLSLRRLTNARNQVNWQIVTTLAATPEGMKPANQVGFFEGTAQALVFPQYSLEALRGAKSLSNMKQLNLGVQQLVQDFDETFAFAPQYVQEALKPYLGKDEETEPLWMIPGHPKEIYAFNANLSGLKLADVDEIARTVMFYEGANEKPVFRYHGKAAIGFTDGHAKLMTPGEMKDVIWKP